VRARDKKQLIRDFRFAFGSPEGKRVLEDLRHRAMMIDMSAVELDKHLNTNGVMFNEGRRSVLLYIYKMIESDPYKDRPSTVKENEDGLL
jgi:hypothetical protein